MTVQPVLPKKNKCRDIKIYLMVTKDGETTEHILEEGICVDTGDLKEDGREAVEAIARNLWSTYYAENENGGDN